MAEEKKNDRIRTISMPVELWDRVKVLADRDRRSVNAQLIVIVEEVVGRADA